MSDKHEARAFALGRGLIDAPNLALLGSRSEFVSLIHRVPSDSISWQPASDAGVEVSVRRDDLIDPALGGNKLYKLWGHIQEWRVSGKQALVSCGGAFSNHLYALAAFGCLSGVPTFGIVRGERPVTLSPTLIDLDRMGMTLRFVSRSEFRRKPEQEWLETLEGETGLGCHWIPEGGGAEPGRRGCQELGAHLGKQGWDKIFLACGTGTMMLGLAEGLSQVGSDAELCGVSVLRSRNSLALSLVHEKAIRRVNWSLTNQFHAGGYAKSTSELDQFRVSFNTETGIALDRVYTAKMFYALENMLRWGRIGRGQRVLAIHSGGLQGNRVAAN